MLPTTEGDTFIYLDEQSQVAEDLTCPTMSVAGETANVVEHRTIYQLVAEDLVSRNWNDKVVRRALNRLADLCSNERNVNAKENREKVLAVGGHLAVTQIMFKYREELTIQEEAVRLLSWLAWSPKGRDSIGQVRGCEAVVMAMKRHPKSLNLQWRGAGCLANLMGGTNPDHKENAVAIERAGGITAVVQAMSCFRDNGGMQQKACFALECLVFWEDLRKKVVKAQGVSCVAEAIQNHSNDEAVQARARRVLATII